MTSRSAALSLAGALLALGCNSQQGEGTLTESALTIQAALTVTPTATLQITALDGTTPVMTDLWLYTLDGAQPTPLTDFTSTAPRKTPRLMLPATIGGKPSGLSPADDDRMNGLMTNTTRGVLEDGAFVATFDGNVTVTLASTPTAPILIVAGVEDQRYAGAAVIQPDGSPGLVPAGVGVPTTHPLRSFSREVAPILSKQCAVCHNAAGPAGASLYLVTGTRDELVNDNFARKEQTEDCQADNPGDGAALDACIQGITKAQFLVEPGAPAASDLLQRSRPDEDAGGSALGLAWFGGGNPKARYSAGYGDRRMPSTTISTNPADWRDSPTAFDLNAGEYQALYDWVAQGARDN